MKMTSGETEAAIPPLQELLDERERYEGWIRALEQRESVTSPNVYRRVHGDYALRLERVLQRLSERTEQLRVTTQELATRLADLRKREAGRIEARQEGELRAAVGEYDEEHWGRLREEADGEIAVIAEERRDVEAELAQMERIIESATAASPHGGGTVVDSVASATTSATTREVPAPPLPAHTTPQSPAQGAETVPAGSRGSSGLLGSLPPFMQGVGTAGAASRPSTPRPASPQDLAAGKGNASTVAAVEHKEPPPFTVPPVHASTQQVSAGESKREQEKTLKCPECGTMNYATEWYCEHCGGELATF